MRPSDIIRDAGILRVSASARRDPGNPDASEFRRCTPLASSSIYSLWSAHQVWNQTAHQIGRQPDAARIVGLDPNWIKPPISLDSNPPPPSPLQPLVLGKTCLSWEQKLK